jgi:DNA-binding transcriptional regulator GbsR (MarR family)
MLERRDNSSDIGTHLGAASASGSASGDGILHDSQERFIALWGQMASSWGIPRTMAEVHGLLFLADEPLNTDDIMQRLHISRGSASMTLRSLQDWGIVSRAHLRGDRKEYFQAEQDVWKLFRTILRERKKREIDPLLEELHTCKALTDSLETKGAKRRTLDAEATRLKALNDRLADMIAFVEMIDAISNRLMNSSGKGLQLAAKLLAKAS